MGLRASVSCGSAEDSGEAVASTGGSFPVTIEHEFGATTITEKPERVVTLGVTDADAVIALGIIPVANAGFSFYESGLGPWTEDEVGDADLTRIASDSQPNLEQIAELAPDLIIGISAGFDEAVYDKLDAIAPTIARPAGTAAYTVDRAVATDTIAAALGEAELGAELNRQTQELLDGTRANHPEFAERTGVAVLPYDGQYGAFLPGDARGAISYNSVLSIPYAIDSVVPRLAGS